MAQLEKEKILKELAVLDSIERIQKEEEERLLAEFLKPYRVDTLSLWKDWSFVENYSFGKNRGGIPMITELNALHPYFRDKVYLLIQKCKAKGIDLAVVESYRTRAKQSEYKSMGKKYTRSGAGKSKHQYGLAIDVVPIVNGEAQWHNKYLWKRIGVIGEQLGLRWGGRWRSLYDPGHFEWTGGLSSQDLAVGKLPIIPKVKSYPCINYDLQLLSIYWENWEAEQASYAKTSQVK
ncbi:MAG: M15 family metallopeptidase [Cyclobacteriaceae bacterium]|nr:M15 family metallopeptidase [Cyclobacteriaceae bacterium]